MPHNFDHWGSLPKVSCTCITYGRPVLLGEAVQSFLDQDYPGEAELVILNDEAQTRLIGEELSMGGREIRIINAPQRFDTVGAKRNECTALARGEVILPWDDDDIHLPWRISLTVARMTNFNHWKADSLWFWNKGDIRNGAPTKAMAPSMAGYSKEIFERVGGYDPIQSGQDVTLENKFAKVGIRMIDGLKPHEVYYIYRFSGTRSYHLSSYGYGKGYEEVGRYVERRTRVKGEVRIIPHYKQDYLDLINNICSDLD